MTRDNRSSNQPNHREHLVHRGGMMVLGSLMGLFSSLIAFGDTMDATTTATTAIPVFMGDASLVCDSQQFYAGDGTLSRGTKDCSIKVQTLGRDTAPTVCTTNGQVGCLAATGGMLAVDYTNVKAANIRSGVLIAGVMGAVTPIGGDCADSNVIGCVTTSAFPSADFTNLKAGNIKNGVVVAGVTGTYPSAATPLASNTALPDLASFGPTTPVGAYEFFDSTGAVYNAIIADGGTITPTLVNQSLSTAGTMYRAVKIAGDANLVAANIRTGTTLFGVSGSDSSMPAVCSSDGSSGCIADGTSYKAAAFASLANKVLSGQTVAGVAGNVTLPAVNNVRTTSGSFGVGGTGSVPTLANCSSDGASGCVATGPTYVAALTTGIASKIITGNTVAGVAGSAIALHPNCAADGAIGCVTVAAYKSADASSAIAANIKTGVTIGGIAGNVIAESHSSCASDGGTNCVTVAAYTAAATSGLANKVLSGQTVAGVAGNITLPAVGNVRVTGGSYGLGGTGLTPTLADCASDGGVSCVVVGPSYAAAFTTALAPKILLGDTVAGVGGTAVAVHPNCTSDAAIGCLTVAGYVSANTSAIATTDMRSGKTIAGINGAVASCSSDGGSSCITGGSYLAANTSGLADKVLSGQTVAGTGGDVTLPAVGRVLSGTSYGVSGNGSSGTLTLPTASNIITGSGTYGDPGSPRTPSYNISFPTRDTPPSAPVVNVASFNYGPDTIVVNWSSVAGAAGYVVLAHAGAAVTFNPADGSSYSTGAQGSDTIIYVGSSNSYSYATTLTAGVTVYFAVYSYTASNIYSADPGTDKLLSCAGLAGGTWVPVPGNSLYGTNAFCVMKYTATNSSAVATSQPSNPQWDSIDQIDARTQCASLGDGYHLISNPEWMTVATNIANVGANWSGGSVGNGYLSSGRSNCNSSDKACIANASDSYGWGSCGNANNYCSTSNSGAFNVKRTQTLSNGNVIWDMAGNIFQWVDFNDLNDKPSVPDISVYTDYSNAGLTFSGTTPRSIFVPIHSNQSWWNDTWDKDQGVGQIFPAAQGVGGAMIRGGQWNQTIPASGLFNALLCEAPVDATNLTIGFRCTWHP